MFKLAYSNYSCSMVVSELIHQWFFFLFIPRNIKFVRTKTREPGVGAAVPGFEFQVALLRRPRGIYIFLPEGVAS